MDSYTDNFLNQLKFEKRETKHWKIEKRETTQKIWNQGDNTENLKKPWNLEKGRQNTEIEKRETKQWNLERGRQFTEFYQRETTHWNFERKRRLTEIL